MVVVAALTGLAALVLFDGPPWVLDVTVLAQAIATLSAGVLIVRRTRTQSRLVRHGWLLIGSAFVTAAVGMVVAGAVGMFSDSIARFGWWDLIFQASFVMGIVGITQLPHGGGTKNHRLQTVFDGFIGGLSIALLLWVAFVAEIVAAFPSGTFEGTIARTYPILDLTILVAAITVAVRRAAVRFDPRMLILSAGLAIQALVDLVYLDATRVDPFLAGNSERLVIGMATVAVAAYYAVAVMPETPVEARISKDRAPFAITAFPYVMVSSLIAVLGMEAALDAELVPREYGFVFFIGVAAVIVMLVIRQAVAIRENRVMLDVQRSELVAAISHEVRTPLSAVLASLELLEGYGPDLPEEEQSELAAIALEQTRYMARMVEDMVLLARNRGNGLKLRPRVVPLAELISQAITDTSMGDIVVAGPTDLILKGDPDRLRQAIGNYLTNAVRYGGSRCQIWVSHVGEQAVVEVHDNGPGVPFRFREVIWDHFERGSHRLNSQVQGSGIGLAVVAAIATAHGGSVEYRKSEKLGGACFSIVLPLAG